MRTAGRRGHGQRDMVFEGCNITAHWPALALQCVALRRRHQGLILINVVLLVGIVSMVRVRHDAAGDPPVSCTTLEDSGGCQRLDL